MEDDATIARIADGLTKAQRHLLRSLAPMLGCSDPEARNHRGFTYAVRARGQGLVSCLALSRRGLVERRDGRPTAYERARVGFVWLTEAGLAVKAILDKEGGQ